MFSIIDNYFNLWIIFLKDIRFVDSQCGDFFRIRIILFNKIIIRTEFSISETYIQNSLVRVNSYDLLK